MTNSSSSRPFAINLIILRETTYEKTVIHLPFFLFSSISLY